MSKTPKSMALAMAALLAGALASNAGCMSDLMDPEQQNETADLFQAVDLGGVAPDLLTPAADLFQAADLTPVADMTPPPDLTPAPDLRPQPDLAPEHIPCNGPCKAAPNADVACVNDACTIKCKAGFADCDGVYANGCETDLLNDAANCGGCGAKCSAVNSTPACTAGQCRINICNPGWADCDRNPVNGCEINVVSDAGNCGGCGVACPGVVNGKAQCTFGACVYACAAGWADCDNNAANGCEANLVDTRSCGGCGNICSDNNIATPACGNGACDGACDKGWADCNSNKLTDGCEVELGWDDANCGACGNACVAVANGYSGCGRGTCQIWQCARGFMDCDRVYANGCEANLPTDVKNCGGCGIACGRGLVCSGGSCLLACGPGFTNCGNAYCAATASDPANCGACGTVCVAEHAAPACKAGACGLGECDAGWGDCDGKVLFGCEADLTTDAANCGGCGKACAGGETCQAGKCVAPPKPEWKVTVKVTAPAEAEVFLMYGDNLTSRGSAPHVATLNQAEACLWGVEIALRVGLNIDPAMPWYACPLDPRSPKDFTGVVVEVNGQVKPNAFATHTWVCENQPPGNIVLTRADLGCK